MLLPSASRSQEPDKHDGWQPNFSPCAGSLMGAAWAINLAVAE
jgi:hypothetical protein